MVSVTVSRPNPLRPKVCDDGDQEPILCYQDLPVCLAPTPIRFGIMGSSRDGHTFIVVGPDGRPRWRADHRGAPNFMMHFPVGRLADKMRAGRAGV